MKQINTLKKHQQRNNTRLSTLLLIALAGLSSFTQANEKRYNTLSHGGFSSVNPSSINASPINTPPINNTISVLRAMPQAVSDQASGIATNKTREQMQQMLTADVNSTGLSLKTINNSYSVEYSADFSIYDAVSILDDDFDWDGYYQTFTVQFDADVESYTMQESREVYALLYLSENGGPWLHYYTTDDFIIVGSSEDDIYEVSTTLLTDYAPEYYDVLIDLYQVGYSDVVATYSSDDSNALYALPLESSDYDIVYEEVIIIEESAGSTSLLGLLFILFIAVNRFSKSNKLA